MLVLANAVILGSESRGTHDHILLYQIWDSPNLEGQNPYLYPIDIGWPSYTPRHCLPSSRPGSLSFGSDYGKENGFQSRIHGNVCLSPSDGLFPRIYLHGNVFTEPLPSTGSMRHSIIMNNVGHWSAIVDTWAVDWAFLTMNGHSLYWSRFHAVVYRRFWSLTVRYILHTLYILKWYLLVSVVTSKSGNAWVHEIDKNRCC
jgi:hypothetical protein